MLACPSPALDIRQQKIPPGFPGGISETKPPHIISSYGLFVVVFAVFPLVPDVTWQADVTLFVKPHTQNLNTHKKYIKNNVVLRLSVQFFTFKTYSQPLLFPENPGHHLYRHHKLLKLVTR